MVKVYDRSKWNAPNPERRLQILRVLDEQYSKFDDILTRLNELPTIPGTKKWNRTTLTVYLWVMGKDGWINHEDRRKAPYFLNKNNPDAMSKLGVTVKTD